MKHTFPFPGHTMLLPDIVRAENCHLYDSDGNRYLDLESGVWCTSIGHGNPAIKAAISQQMDAISHIGFCYSARAVEDAAQVILDLLDHQEGRCTFLCSGSEAVEYGTRIVRTTSTRPRIMTMGDSYFGAYGDAATRSDDGWFIFDWFDCEDCDKESCTTACPRWASIPFEEIGAFLFEPGSSSGLVRFPPAQLVNTLAKTLAEQDSLVMVNEVTTGIGRTGTWFGFQHYDLQPDIVAMGKGVGNGYPVSVTSINVRVVERLEGKPIAYGQSHLNDPLGAVVAEAVINHIREENLIERSRPLSEALLGGLRAIAEKSPHLKTIRGRGLMAIMELDEDPDFSRTTKLHEQLVENGFILVHRPGSNMLRMDPPLTIGEQDILQFLETLERLLGQY